MHILSVILLGMIRRIKLDYLLGASHLFESLGKEDNQEAVFKDLIPNFATRHSPIVILVVFSVLVEY